ncbi:hypothetical protein TIFTF001_012136 [Ficus carica]|uniref:Bifunctional inhibitor/plant lipid transfer protein/seed storage helical domain-containing protein n=1 Tax=Ficus carica TaxID=3494 RepID=A0AA88D5Z3_FICCA|nr:hypothetical protein TIFTF001_012136 [Ficus carica]
MIILLSSSAVLVAPCPAPAPDVDSCASTIQPLMPCLDYVRTKEDKPSQSCATARRSRASRRRPRKPGRPPASALSGR